VAGERRQRRGLLHRALGGGVEQRAARAGDGLDAVGVAGGVDAEAHLGLALQRALARDRRVDGGGLHAAADRLEALGGRFLEAAPLIDKGLAVAAELGSHRIEKLVVDPVMVAKSGDQLLQPEARAALADRILPLALLVTPNLPEAEVLAGMRVAEPEDMEEAARRIHLMGPRYVLVKGGHLKGDATDLLWNGREFTRFSTPRIDSQNTHGTGCTFSAAITARLALGDESV